MLASENHPNHDSDSDEDDPAYWHPGNHLDTLAADSIKQVNNVRESRIGRIAADSMKHPHMARESHIGSIATDSMKISQPAHHHNPEDHSKFSFHNFGFHPTPFTDLLKTINTMREAYNASSAEYEAMHRHQHSQKASGTVSKTRKPTGPFDIKEFQKTQAKTRTNHKISQFREQQLKWDMSAPDAELLKELYRTYESDPTGKRIFNLSRDEAKGATPWRPAEFDKDIAAPDISALSPTFQKMLLQHIDCVVAQVQAEYDKLPQNTQAQSEIKAKVGADLANLKRRQSELYKGVQSSSQTSSN